MRVVSIYDLRKLPVREALEKLREVDYVLDESAMLVPAEEFVRILETTQRPKHDVKVVKACQRQELEL